MQTHMNYMHYALTPDIPGHTVGQTKLLTCSQPASQPYNNKLHVSNRSEGSFWLVKICYFSDALILATNKHVFYTQLK